jgi:uncharacterized membrane protein
VGSALLIWGAYALFAGVGRRSDQPRHEARVILDQRLARGEVDADEYRRLRDPMVNDDDTPAHTGAGR